MKRLTAFVLALLLAAICMDVMGSPLCSQLDPSSWLYWLAGCPIIAGGGGSGAS